MKSYPSISRDIDLSVDIYAFDKLDGSNIRAEWNIKHKFHKFGSRNRLIGTDQLFLSESIELIKNKYEKELSDIFLKQRLGQCICFFEFFGNNSFAGFHIEEEHDVVLFDVDIYKQGLLQPRDFLRWFDNKIDIPSMLYHGKANKIFIENVKNGCLEKMTFEGVVCKGGLNKKRKPILFKVKNLQWIERLRNYCQGDENLFQQLL